MFDDRFEVAAPALLPAFRVPHVFEQDYYAVLGEAMAKLP